MEVSLCSGVVFSLEGVLVAITRCLTRRWARALMCASTHGIGSDQAKRERMVEGSWDVCLIALSHAATNSDLHLYTLQLDKRSGWERQVCNIPGDISVIVGDGTSVYLLGGNTDTWRLKMQTCELQELAQRPAQHGPEAVMAGGRLLVLGGYEYYGTAGNRGGGGGILSNRVSAYSVETDSWTILESMPTARASHFACATDGTRVFVSGGLGNLGPTKSAEILDIACCRPPAWSSLPAMSRERFRCAGAVDRGQFYAIGGQFEAGCDTLVYDGATGSKPESNAWVPAADMPVRDMYCRASVAEGRIFVACRSAVAVFYPLQNRWAPFVALPGACVTLCSTLTPKPAAIGQPEMIDP